MIHETEDLINRLDLNEVLDPRPARRALGVMAAVLVVALGLVVVAPRSAAIALARLSNPFVNVAWPQRHQLAAATTGVERVAAGQSFEIEVIDTHGVKLPEHANIIYRFAHPDGEFTEQKEPLVWAGSALVARRDNVTRPFSYRVVGGDDRSMAWVDLQVVEPPALESLSLLLHFPEYTGWHDRPAEHHLRALVGTRVSVVGRSRN